MNPERGSASDDLWEALASGDVLESFRSLPEEIRHEFEAWIEKARDGEAHWRRIDILVMALRCAPRLEIAIAPDLGPVTEIGGR